MDTTQKALLHSKIGAIMDANPAYGSENAIARLCLEDPDIEAMVPAEDAFVAWLRSHVSRVIKESRAGICHLDDPNQMAFAWFPTYDEDESGKRVHYHKRIKDFSQPEAVRMMNAHVAQTKGDIAVINACYRYFTEVKGYEIEDPWREGIPEIHQPLLT